MTNIEQKALELVNEVSKEMGLSRSEKLDLDLASHRALLRAIEQHEAFRQQVSNAVEGYRSQLPAYLRRDIFDYQFAAFIIAKPDPLDDLLQSIVVAVDVKDLREALDRAGLEIREKSGG